MPVAHLRYVFRPVQEYLTPDSCVTTRRVGSGAEIALALLPIKSPGIRW